MIYIHQHWHYGNDIRDTYHAVESLDSPYLFLALGVFVPLSRFSREFRAELQAHGVAEFGWGRYTVIPEVPDGATVQAWKVPITAVTVGTGTYSY